MIINQETVISREAYKKPVDIIIDFIKIVSEKLKIQNNIESNEVTVDFDTVNLLLDSFLSELYESSSPNFYLFYRLKNIFNIFFTMENKNEGVKIIGKILLLIQKYFGKNKDFSDMKFKHEITLLEGEFYELIDTDEEEDKKLLSGIYDSLKEI
ncbi:hypothetical protein [Methanobrevibacter curvatus]|uniref:Uncharacterized protein n=1 Tax=Methanobrevibacter curvatus TaxID=49547 RepID=A0A166C8T2_9EURY|nr:hypothetical protein [Methanobrevibacter curvatus]KZX12277.1 hypothetical protein MBCUR_11290 [Methanobrevibacter curvatus]